VHTSKSVLLIASVWFVIGCDSGGAGSAASSSAVEVATKSSGEGEAVRSGEEIYRRACFSCHDNGLSGAPIIGDSAMWAPRIAKGVPLLVQSTMDGVPPAMPPKGMCFDCTVAELTRVVEYMVSSSQ